MRHRAALSLALGALAAPWLPLRTAARAQSPTTPEIGAQFRPPEGDFSPDPIREQALMALAVSHAATPAEGEVVFQGLALIAQQHPAAYLLLTRVATSPAAADLPQITGHWWRQVATSAPDRLSRSLATLYHEYIHVGTRAGNGLPDVREPVRIPGTHWYAADGAWLGVYGGRFDEWFPTPELQADIAEPQDFDRAYLALPPDSGNDLHTILDELNAYTRDAELQMALVPVLPHGPSRTRYAILRQLYHLELYLARLQNVYPAQWNRLLGYGDLGYLIKGLWDRAWDRIRELDAYPALSIESGQAETDTLAHAGPAMSLFSSAGLEAPASLEPSFPTLLERGVRVFRFS